MQPEELRCLLALWRADGIGPATIAKIIEKNISFVELFHQPKTVIHHAHLPERLLAAINQADWRGVDADLAWAVQANHHLITFAMPDYPALLQQISAAPPILFVSGDVTLLSQPQLAMVGTRHPTPAGKDIALQFAKAFVREGLIITSGLAAGIDAASHEGALAAEGKTIAVMGTGPDKIYPRQHDKLKRRIEENGAIVTEFPVGVNVAANHFPRRNRIISGLSLGVLVVEAASESGSLITAHYALEQNREVFAIPGSIHNPLARGCHALIKQGAKLVETVPEVLEELRWKKGGASVSASTTSLPVPAILPPEQRQLLAVMGFEQAAVDVLVQRSGLTAETVSSMLLLLELQGQIAAVPGGYVRCPQPSSH